MENWDLIGDIIGIDWEYFVGDISYIPIGDISYIQPSPVVIWLSLGYECYNRI